MDPERWRKVEQVYNSALQRNADERQTYLDSACAGDQELRREVDSLLACQPSAEGFIDTPAMQQMARELADTQIRAPAPDLSGRTLLHYRVEGKIGQGGMGVVYKAWDIHLNRFVAIKAIPLAS